MSACREANIQAKPSELGPSHKGMLWSPSCFAASCGGDLISIIRHYIEQQHMPD
jgi:putative transposase